MKTSKSSNNLAQSASQSAVKKGLKPELPGRPGLSVKDVTSRSVTLQWTPPSNTGEFQDLVGGGIVSNH